MQRPRDMIAGEQLGEPLDLPPMAEAEDILLVAAGTGSGRGNGRGVRTIFGDQGHGVVERRTSAEEIIIHRSALDAGCCIPAHERR